MPPKYKILVADDSRDFVAILCKLLERNGYETLTASEGIRAIELAVKKKPDLILLDIMMPAGDGIRVLESLRSRPATKSLPIFVMTASIEPQLEEQVRQKGAQGTLFKPFDSDLLLAKIKSLLPG